MKTSLGLRLKRSFEVLAKIGYGSLTLLSRTFMFSLSFTVEIETFNPSGWQVGKGIMGP